MLLAIGFVVLGGWLLGFTDGKPKPPFPWAGWLAIPFFGSCAVILALRLFDREPQIIIDSDGVFSKHWFLSVTGTNRQFHELVAAVD